MFQNELKMQKEGLSDLKIAANLGHPGLSAKY